MENSTQAGAALRVGFVQFDPVFGDVPGNLARAGRLVESVQADLLVLPELFSTGYLFTSHEEVRALSEAVPEGPTTRELLSLARERRMVLVAGAAEQAGNACHNSAVVVSPRGLEAVYRKVHLFGEERIWFAPGTGPFPVVDLPGVRLGVMICFDWFFPEACRSLALGGAQVVAHPSNLVLPHCPAAMITRCLENRVFAVTANRVGKEERGGRHLAYIGQSQVVDPEGRVLVRAGENTEEVQTVELHPRAADSKVLSSGNDLWQDRRPELYGALVGSREVVLDFPETPAKPAGDPGCGGSSPRRRGYPPGL